MTTGALFVARFSGPENLISATSALQQCAEVKSWSAVSGHVHLVVSLSTPSAKIPRTLTTLTGISEFHAYDIDDGGRTPVIDPSACHAYAFIEADAERCPEVKRALTSDAHVVWCAEVNGGRELVAVVKGENFEAIDRHVEHHVRTLDGVIRLKYDRVIDLRQL